MSSRIDRYRPEELLGSAGIVDTFRVRTQDENQPAVLKVFFPDRVKGGEGAVVAERFLAAGRRALLGHLPGMAKVLEVSESLEAAFVATELVPGLDLSDLVRRARSAGRLDPVLAGLICAEVASVLACAHEARPALFHLGLSPGNVRVTEDGRVVVLDFGLTAAVRTADGCRKETWEFVAPEMVGLDATTAPAEAALAADLYSLGLLLSYLLGSGTVEGGPAGVAAAAGMSSSPPKHLASAMRVLLAPDPKDRPSSARLVVDWLSEGHPSPEERRSRLAAGLLDLAGGKVPPARATRSVPAPAPRPKVAVSNLRPLPAARSASAKPPAAEARIYPRVARAALAGAALLVLAASAWLMVTHQNRPGPATLARDTTTPRKLKAAAVAVDPETQVKAAAKDGGAPGGIPAVVPAGQGYVPDSDQMPSRIPRHLFLDTSPSQADVWVDGVLRGKTPVDLVTGPGGHRVVVIKPGYLMLHATYDTTQGDYARRELQRAGPPKLGNAFLDVRCPTANRYPILLDDEETGRLCPTSRLPLTSGKHTVGIFVPSRRANLAVEVYAPPGHAPTVVNLKE